MHTCASGVVPPQIMVTNRGCLKFLQAYVVFFTFFCVCLIVCYCCTVRSCTWFKCTERTNTAVPLSPSYKGLRREREAPLLLFNPGRTVRHTGGKEVAFFIQLYFPLFLFLAHRYTYTVQKWSSSLADNFIIFLMPHFGKNTYFLSFSRITFDFWAFLFFFFGQHEK